MNTRSANYFVSGCMVCGSELVVKEGAEKVVCHYCGEPYVTHITCEKGHYVCDSCHSSESVRLITSICRESRERDAALLMQAIRSHKSFPIHGPEHHILVPAVILTALRNNGADITEEQIRTAVQRGRTVPGGSCGFMGVCGAATGAGIAYSILTGASPYDPELRQAVQKSTAAVLEEIASYSAARCCQRDTWIALKKISELLEQNLGLNMPVSPIRCRQFSLNKECIHENCPLRDPQIITTDGHGKTWSLCPVCLKRITADRIMKEGKVYLRKTCEDHGTFQTLIWRGYYSFDEWIGNQHVQFSHAPQCPDNCGLCDDHLQKTCCVLLNVTDNCNLDCTFCLANQQNGKKDPPLSEICESLNNLMVAGKSLVQLSGGEPTTRADLPDIVRAARQAGAKYVQLNTNGIRLGDDPEYVKALADAGLSFVFMQFDGTDDSINVKLRNRPLLEAKKRAIKNCAAFNLGVTLVPTLVRGVNTNNIGDIIRFAVNSSPAVRGVHFQPVSFFGRVPRLPSDDDRFTLDELVHEISLQTGGKIDPANLLPSRCDHPLCGFHGDFVIDSNHELFPLSERGCSEGTGCCDPDSAERNREFVARRWQRPAEETGRETGRSGDLHDMEYFLSRVKTHGFTLTAMAFQDAGNIDLARLQHCSFHVYDKGRMMPFCAYYLNSWPGVAGQPCT